MTKLESIWLISIFFAIIVPSIFLYAAMIVCYYTDPMFRMQYGKPPLWPWKKGNHK